MGPTTTVRPIEPSDAPWARVVAGCQQGDRAMQRELYERCRQQIQRLAVRMVGQQDAADVSQQVFLKIFQGIDGFLGRAHLNTWIYRIAVNECLQFRRSRVRSKCESLEIETASTTVPPVDRSARRELLEIALQRLDPELRCVFLLREVEKMSYAQIAKAMQIAEGTVGSRLNRARCALRKCLEELGWEE